MGRVLGVDLGTYKSCMAVIHECMPVIIENSEGARSTPSVVAFTKTGECLVGEAAKRQAVIDPQNTICSIKRFMGRKRGEVQDELDRVPYNVVEAPNGDAHIQVTVHGETRTYSPEEISAMILGKLKADAETNLRERITEAVITVPTSFNERQRIATRNAGKIAGFNVLRIISEPSAASLAHGCSHKTEGLIAIFDLGAGNLSASIIEVGDGVFEVKATCAALNINGDRWDDAIMKWVLDEFHSDTGIDLTDWSDATQRIREEAKKAKVALSSSHSYEIALPFITSGKTGSTSIKRTLTRQILEQLTEWTHKRSVEPLRICLKDAGVSASDIYETVLIGGMTRIPSIVETVRNVGCGKLSRAINPDEAVALGAAIEGGVLRGDVKDVLHLDVTSYTFAIETVGGAITPMIPRNTSIPTRRSVIFSTYYDDQTCLEVKVVQGESPFSKGNKTLGIVRLDGIPAARRGLPQIEVTFDIDANSILHVSVKDLGTGKEQKISVV